MNCEVLAVVSSAAAARKEVEKLAFWVKLKRKLSATSWRGNAESSLSIGRLLADRPGDSARHAKRGLFEVIAGVRLELRRYPLAAKCGYDLVRSRCDVAQKSARGLRFLAAKREICAIDWTGEWRLGGKVREIGIPKRARGACNAGEGRRVECRPGGEKPCK